jgi:hypothetical protein
MRAASARMRNYSENTAINGHAVKVKSCEDKTIVKRQESPRNGINAKQCNYCVISEASVKFEMLRGNTVRLTFWGMKRRASCNQCGNDHLKK